MTNIKWCIDYLKKHNEISEEIALLNDKAFRALMNITMPISLSDEYYKKQDDSLKEIYNLKKIVDVKKLIALKNKIYLYKGDITEIKADAIVNACNEKLLGCFIPLHNCIDNAIHSFAGLQVRRDLIKIMNEQGHDEPLGNAKITKGYNLPSKYIIHTVGPSIKGRITKQNEQDLYNCYLSSLRLADKYELKSIVLCSISTGIYAYPIRNAAKVALNAVSKYLKEENKNLEKIVFNVFSDNDYLVYLDTIKESL